MQKFGIFYLCTMVSLTSLLARFILVVIVLSSCQAYYMVCPEPEKVRLRKMYANRMRKKRMKDWDRSREKPQYDFNRESEYDVKETKYLEIWDCPEPGTRQDHRIEARRRKAWRKYEARQKHQLNSEEHTLDPFAERNGSR